jgi:hypothetical protein
MTNEQKETLNKKIKDWIFNGVEPDITGDELQDYMLKKEILQVMKKELLKAKLKSI